MAFSEVSWKDRRKQRWDHKSMDEDEQHNIPAAIHSAPPAGSGVSAAIAHDTVTQLYANSTSGLIASLALASVLVATHWAWIAHPVLLAWWSGMALLIAARAILVRRFNSSKLGTPPATWFARHLVGVTLSGIGWGAAGILLLTPHSVEHQAFLSMVLAGMVAGSVPIFAASRRTFLAFALPACLPIIAQFLLMGDSIHLAIGGAGLLFLGIMTSLVWTINRSLMRMFLLSAERTQSDKQLFDLFEQTHDIIQSVTQDGRLLFANHAWQETLGYSAAEVESLNIFNVLHPDSHDHCRHIMQRIMAGKDVGLVEFTFLTKSGRTVIAEGHMSLRAENGQPMATRGIFRDITERKAAEARLHTVNQNLEQLVAERTGKLRKSEALYRNLMATVPGAVYEFQIDAAGRRAFPFMSQGITDLIGISPDECMANADVVFRRILPDALPAIDESIRQSLESLSPWLHEFPVTTLSGETKWLRGHSVPHRDNAGATLWHGILTNITVHKQAEEALRASEERFRAAYHNASVGMSISDLAGKLQEVNAPLCQILGYSRQELLTKDFQSLTHPKDLPGNMDRIHGLLAGTVAHQAFEKRYIRKDGTTVWAQVGLSVIHGHDRTPSHLLAMVQDITDRKQMEEALRASEERFNLAVQGSQTGIWDWDLRTNQVYFSPLWKQQLGYEIDELENHFKEWQDRLHPDDLDRAMATIHAYLDGQTDHYEFEHRLRHKDGSYRWILARGVSIRDAQGKPYRMAGSHIDITDRKQTELARQKSEERFAYVIEATNDGIWDWDIPTGTVYFSPQWIRLLGYSPEEVLPSVEFFLTILHPDDTARMTQVLQTHMAGQTPVKELEIRLRQKSGEYRWFLDRGKVVTRDRHGSPLRMVGTITDITERKQAEAALQASQDQILQMQKMEALGQLAGGIAHDFNNILTAILGNAEIAMSKSEADHPARPNLARILKAGQRASDTVQQILTFARRQDISRVALTLAPIVAETLGLLRALLPAGIELTSTCDAATPHVLANTTQLHQVLMNLCTNAWHALGDQPGRITVTLAPATLSEPLRSLHATVPPGHYARISVHDTGCGMPPETMARIFDPFFTTKPLGQGTGLGLSVVHGIMESHHGAVVVESATGQGATFHLYFPAVAAPASASAEAPRQTTPSRPYHVLYLDDEEMLVELVQALFEPLGYHITGCTKPDEALALVRADPDRFDVVVTDYNMPERSGLEVALELAHIRGTLPVVLVSGYLTAADQAAAHATPVKEIIHKPTLLQELGPVLTRLLDSPPAG